MLLEVRREISRGRCWGGERRVSFYFFTRRHCPSYRLQWWSCPGATQWGTPFSKEGLSGLALAGGSRNPWVRRRAAVSIDTNNKLVSLLLFVCVCVWECGVCKWHVVCGHISQCQLNHLLAKPDRFQHFALGVAGFEADTLCLPVWASKYFVTLL